MTLDWFAYFRAATRQIIDETDADHITENGSETKSGKCENSFALNVKGDNKTEKCKTQKPKNGERTKTKIRFQFALSSMQKFVSFVVGCDEMEMCILHVSTGKV